jgi:hypothetical protein
MLEEHRNVVEALRDALLDREELIGDDILEAIRGAKVPASPADEGVRATSSGGTKVGAAGTQLRS